MTRDLSSHAHSTSRRWPLSIAARLVAVVLLTCFFAYGPAAAQSPARRQTRPRAAAPSRPNTAQQGTRATGAQQTSTASDVSEEEADLAIKANVRARELRFEEVPNPTVEFTGKPARRTVWEAERENLPQQVRPGETYRDIGVRLRILSVFADIDRIVAEALGEVPPTADAPPPQQNQPPAQNPPSTPPQDQALQTPPTQQAADAPRATTARRQTSPTVKRQVSRGRRP